MCEMKQLSRTVCNELQNSYREVDLEWLVLREDSEYTIRRGNLKRGLQVYANMSRVEKSNGRLNWKDYGAEIDQSFESFIHDCIRYGILVETNEGLLKMVMADSPLMVSERDGFRMELNRTYPYTVYRKRMNTSGSMDIKANGDPAIEGVTAQSALSW